MAILLPCPICNGVEGCDHTVPERVAAATLRPGGLTAEQVKAFFSLPDDDDTMHSGQH